MKKYPLPPLALFNTFEVVARHGSVTRAAEELCLTQSAVSRQIKALETDLGQDLFFRLHRGISLTDEGRLLFDAVRAGLDGVSAAVSTFKTASAFPQITVAASVSFSYYWLMPRLERFSTLYPDVDLRVLASDQKPDLRRDGADVAVLQGDGQWDGIDARLLFGERVCPVCSPSYLAAHPELRAAANLLDQTLLHLDGGGNIWGSVDWRVWLSSQGVMGQPARRGIQINSYPMVLQAAEAGRGVALGWSYITDPMIATGKLICPVNKPLETQQGYYVAALQDRAGDPMVAAFVQWVLSESKAETLRFA